MTKYCLFFRPFPGLLALGSFAAGLVWGSRADY